MKTVTYSNLLIVAIMAIFTSACDSGSSGGGSSSKTSVNASGTWSGQTSSGIGFTAEITQNKKNLGGTATRSGGINGVIAGTIEGNNASFTIIWDNDITGTYDAAIEGTTMSGTFEEEFSDQVETGTFVATR